MRIAKRFLTAIVVVAILLFACLALFAFWINAAVPLPMLRTHYYDACIDLLKTILIGFSVAVVGTMIPTILAEARHDFERLRDSRIAYSEAKTGFDYLALRLPTLSLLEAASLVQNVHTRKHIAELYDELALHLERRGISKTAAQWGDYIYYYLYQVRHMLEAHALEWDTLTTADRLKLIRNVLPEAPLDKLAAGTLDTNADSKSG